jgi:hypothetical protein
MGGREGKGGERSLCLYLAAGCYIICTNPSRRRAVGCCSEQAISLCNAIPPLIQLRSQSLSLPNTRSIGLSIAIAHIIIQQSQLNKQPLLDDLCNHDVVRRRLFAFKIISEIQVTASLLTSEARAEHRFVGPPPHLTRSRNSSFCPAGRL